MAVSDIISNHMTQHHLTNLQKIEQQGLEHFK